MPKVHFGIFVIKDNIIDNLSDIEKDILNYRIIEQGPFGRGDKLGCDEVMSYLGDVGQMFGLEVYRMPFIVYFPFPLAICEHPKNLRDNLGVRGAYHMFQN